MYKPGLCEEDVQIAILYAEGRDLQIAKEMLETVKMLKNDGFKIWYAANLVVEAARRLKVAKHV